MGGGNLADDTLVELPWEPAWDHPDPESLFTTIMGLPPLWEPQDNTKALVLQAADLELEEDTHDQVRLRGTS